MGIELIVSTHQSAANSYRYFFHKPRIVIGGAEHCDIQLPGKLILPQQLEIRQSGSGAQLSLLARPEQELTLNEATIHPDVDYPLHEGDSLSLFNFLVKVRFPSESRPETTHQNTSEMARLMANEVVELFGMLQDNPTFVVSKGPQRGLRYQFLPSMSQAFIGRSPSCEFFINDSNISREHAVIKRNAERLVVEDLNSRNGIRVNGQRVKQAELSPNDRITLGSTTLTFQTGKTQALPPVEKKKSSSGMKLDRTDTLHELLAPSSTEPVKKRPLQLQEIVILAVAGVFLLGALGIGLYLLL